MTKIAYADRVIEILEKIAERLEYLESVATDTGDWGPDTGIRTLVQDLKDDVEAPR